MKAVFIALGVLLASTVSFANSYSATRKVVVSVGDLKENKSTLWKKEICAQVYMIANDIAEQGVDITCRSFDTDNFLDKDLPALQKNNSYHLRIIRDRNGEIGMDITNWSRRFQSDFTNLGWDFKNAAQGKVTKEQAFAKTVANVFYYIANEDAFRAALLVNGVEESERVKYDQDHGLFLDKSTGTPLTIDQAYSSFEDESPRKKNYLRAGIELGVVFSSGIAWYYKNLVYNAQDFDYGFREGIRKKLSGEAVLFDDNDKFANYGHVYAGVLYYNVARTNGAGALESFLVTFASSAAWEMFEYHEVFSINDQIMTPVGGYVMGEATYQLSCALLQKDSKVAKALGYTVNPVGALNYSMNKWKTGDKFSSQPDCAKERWSDVSVYLGVEKGSKPFVPNEKNTYIVGLNAQVVTIPNYNKTGEDQGLIFDTSLVNLKAENNGGEGMGDLKIIAQIVSAAYHKKSIDKDGRGDLRGYDLIVGLGTASTWNDRGTDKKGGNEDYYGTINILGASAHATIFYGGYKIKAEFGFYGDFAMVKSYALSPIEDTKNNPALATQASTVRKRGYYWGVGHSTLASISVEKGRWTVGYEGQVSSATNINGRDRKYDEVQDPLDFSDSFMSHRVYVMFKITRNLSIQLAHELSIREGSVSGFETRRGVEHRTFGVLVYKF
ncbi:DUF3943 domain-containing protein [Bdellovibrio sp. NC01]|uniref:DUF3943 domain-containing protein n=1 Tax=Bdellovibrio sp. NC01 TaxID=2220073 RepID=UPI00115A4991|nr:DUF3943 domain-containing protein [Bdellovibrio sp. NC01]QDK36749.1 hypothetical protein DOE51_03600 [Bdellovibrio sp. NC01]